MFSLIDMLVVRPIVNILFIIYNFVGDFGLAIIIFVVIVKLLTLPLIKRQLHQTRMMREMQPELAEIKKRCKGNRQMESLQMMDLYKRKNIKPFRSFLLVLIQLPIFMALFTAINVTVRPCEVSGDYNVAVSRCASTKEGNETKYNVNHSAYPFVRTMPRINEIIEKQNNYFVSFQEASDEEKGNVVYDFEPKLFGQVHLDVTALEFTGLFAEGKKRKAISSIVVLVMAIASAFAQFIVARQNDPSRKKGKKQRSMRQIMKEAAKGGKEPSQEEMNAIAQRQTTMMMPFMMLFIMINLPGALVMYYFLNNLVTIVINKVALNSKLSEMEAAADKKILKELKAHEAVEAEIVKDVLIDNSDSKDSKSSHYGNKNKKSSTDSGVHITRISASNKKRRK